MIMERIPWICLGNVLCIKDFWIKLQNFDFLYLLSQVLALFNEIDLIDRDQTASFIASMQQSDGSFFGDKWGMVYYNY